MYDFNRKGMQVKSIHQIKCNKMAVHKLIPIIFDELILIEYKYYEYYAYLLIDR